MVPQQIITELYINEFKISIPHFLSNNSCKFFAIFLYWWIIRKWVSVALLWMVYIEQACCSAPYRLSETNVGKDIWKSQSTKYVIRNLNYTGDPSQMNLQNHFSLAFMFFFLFFFFKLDCLKLNAREILPRKMLIFIFFNLILLGLNVVVWGHGMAHYRHYWL